MKLIIHGGMHKTGTSSLQYSLSKNQYSADVKFDHVYGPRLLRHDLLVYFLILDPTEYNQYYITSNPEFIIGNESINDFINETKDQFFQNFKKKQKYLILSGEAFRHMQSCHIERFIKLITPYVDSYEFVFYVRNPYNYAKSMINQFMSIGNINDIENKNYSPRYHLLDNFKNYNRILVKYENCTSVIDDFANRYNLNLADIFLNTSDNFLNNEVNIEIDIDDLKWAREFYSYEECPDLFDWKEIS